MCIHIRTYELTTLVILVNLKLTPLSLSLSHTHTHTHSYTGGIVGTVIAGFLTDSLFGGRRCPVIAILTLAICPISLFALYVASPLLCENGVVVGEEIVVCSLMCTLLPEVAKQD